MPILSGFVPKGSCDIMSTEANNGMNDGTVEFRLYFTDKETKAVSASSTFLGDVWKPGIRSSFLFNLYVRRAGQ